KAEKIGGDLGKARLVALAVRLRAENERHLAGGLETHAGGFARVGARGLEIAGKPKSAQLTASLGLGAPRREALVIGERQPLLEVFGELPFLDLHAERRAIRDLADDVAAAKLGRRHAHLTCREIDQPLDDVIRLGLTGAAIGIDRYRVGEDAS